MPILEYVKNVWQMLTRNKMRSFLTMMGIIIGVLSVIVIMSVGAGAQSLILDQITGMGSNLVGVLPGKSEEDGPPASAFGIVITTLTDADARAIATSGYEPIEAVSSYVKGIDRVSIGDVEKDTSFVGTSASYTNVEDVTIERGRYFTEDEERAMARVVVLGSEVAKELFPDEDPIGETLKIKRTNFEIIGVVEERGTVTFQNQDNQIFVPVTTAQKLLLGMNHINFMRIKIRDAETVESSIGEIEAILRDRHGIDDPEEDDFSVRATTQALDALTSITDALRFFLAAIAAISLIVGGIGIMNIMLAAVQERTREIGLRKAIGATSRTITFQFLVETACITLTGGIIGIIGGAIISASVGFVARYLGYSWDTVITPGSIVLGCVVSIAIGLIFGIIPARRASKLNPIEALRYE
ncbi:MAG: ABC transporter permease [Patescibacteria group bacterium]